ncbi:hypothetical protein BGP77_13685 [Saccharospirillum sp. MSK14-1]|uniref:hypothetical protein n=1 Tax=Saccharospirillum sp. MSK14-1 TaxID=1897632 RepID=UPI000D3A2A8E|nr:hypothetical protein [Saccharospirillum sp. MSK14-1]PTY37546.1 hypothetical protein BGP77_13685 [Saccharospirillum sp. MSK14-1]
MKKTHRNTFIATALAVALTASASGAFAWGGNDRGQDPSERFNYIFTELNLTEDQAEDVLDVMRTFRDDQRQAMQARRDSGAGRPSAEEFADLRAQAHTALSDQLGTVLSATQVEELMTYLEFHGPMMGGGRHHGRGPQDGQPMPPAPAE